MGFRDYYRQFDDIDEDLLNLERRARRREENRQALARIPDVSADGYTIVGLSASRNTFTLLRQGAGPRKRFCSRRGKGRCPASGRW